MIGRISGRLIEKSPPQVVIDVHGVGYEVDVPMSTYYPLPALGSEISLLIQTVIREDAHLLYGFATMEERSTFRELVKISGVGPRTALSILSGLSVNDLAAAVTLQEASRLTQVPGIGKKTAERLLLELKGRLSGETTASPGSASSNANDVLKALTALGYSEKEALATVKGLPADLDVSEGIRRALRMLSKTA